MTTTRTSRRAQLMGFDPHARLVASKGDGDDAWAEGPAALTGERGWLLATDSDWDRVRRALDTGEPVRLNCDCDPDVRPRALRVTRFVPYSNTIELAPVRDDTNQAAPSTDAESEGSR